MRGALASTDCADRQHRPRLLNSAYGETTTCQDVFYSAGSTAPRWLLLGGVIGLTVIFLCAARLNFCDITIHIDHATMVRLLQHTWNCQNHIMQIKPKLGYISELTLVKERCVPSPQPCLLCICCPAQSDLVVYLPLRCRE